MNLQKKKGHNNLFWSDQSIYPKINSQKTSQKSTEDTFTIKGIEEVKTPFKKE